MHSGSEVFLLPLHSGLTYPTGRLAGSDGHTSSRGPSTIFLHRVNVCATQVADYRSNALNQRVRKTTAAGSTTYVYGPGGELLHEQGPASTSHVWMAGQLLLRVTLFRAAPKSTSTLAKGLQ